MAESGQYHHVTLRTGNVGSGKSFGAMADALTMLQDGGVVAMNYPVPDGWAMSAAGSKVWDWLYPDAKKDRAQEMWKRTFQIGSVDTIYELSKKLPSLVTGKAAKRKEGKGLLILDEAGLYFNSRKWQKNFDFVEVLTQIRKLKWRVCLIAHGENMIDSQIRENLIDCVYSHRNLNQIRIPLPFLRRFPVCPFTMFFSVGVLSGQGAGKGVIADRKFIPFQKHVGGMYDTDSLFSSADAVTEYCSQGNPPIPLAPAYCRPSQPVLRSALVSVFKDLGIENSKYLAG